MFNLGGVLGPVLGFIGQEQTNDTNVMLAREARYHAESMSNTAYQRAVADMRAAGLNPALMFGRGQAASAPVTQPARVESELGAALSSGLQTSQAIASLEQNAALIKKTQAETKNVEADTLIKVVQPDNVRALTALYGASTGREIAQMLKTQEEIPMVKPLAQSAIASNAASAYQQYRTGDLNFERSRNEKSSFGQGRIGRELGVLPSIGGAALEQGRGLLDRFRGWFGR